MFKTFPGKVSSFTPNLVEMGAVDVNTYKKIVFCRPVY
jgi:hypothetical protein